MADSVIHIAFCQGKKRRISPPVINYQVQLEAKTTDGIC